MVSGLHLAVFYGSLRQAVYDPKAPRLNGLGRFAGPCLVPGVLRDHGEYPGLFRGAGRVVGDLVEIYDPAAFFAVFDDWEDYRAEDPAGSLYLRRTVRLIAPRLEAWVYYSNTRRDDPVVTHGDWARHLAGRRPPG